MLRAAARASGSSTSRAAPPVRRAAAALRAHRASTGITRGGRAEPRACRCAPSQLRDRGARSLVFDLETQRSAAEVGGWGIASQMGLALAVVYDVARDAYRTYYEADVDRLLLDLALADRVVGFNIDRFDLAVLSGYTERDLGRIRTLDLLAEIHKRVGFRVSLNHLAEVNLGESKAGDGLAEPAVVEGGAHRPDRAVLPEGRRGDEAPVGAGALAGVPPLPRQGRTHAAHPRGMAMRRGVALVVAAGRLPARAGRRTMTQDPPPRSWEAARARAPRPGRLVRHRCRFAAARSRSARGFSGLAYFPPDPAWRYAGWVERYAPATRMTIVTTAGKTRPCERWGRVTFVREGRVLSLQVYRLLDRPDGPGGGGLFLPFKDANRRGRRRTPPDGTSTSTVRTAVRTSSISTARTTRRARTASPSDSSVR